MRELENGNRTNIHDSGNKTNEEFADILSKDIDKLTKEQDKLRESIEKIDNYQIHYTTERRSEETSKINEEITFAKQCIDKFPDDKLKVEKLTERVNDLEKRLNEIQDFEFDVYTRNNVDKLSDKNKLVIKEYSKKAVEVSEYYSALKEQRMHQTQVIADAINFALLLPTELQDLIERS